MACSGTLAFERLAAESSIIVSNVADEETPQGSSTGADDARQRVSDTERERAESQLRWSFTHGILGLEEFTARLDAVWAASIRTDLNAAVLDLPGGAALTRPEDEQLVLRGTGIPIRRQGQWKPPRRLLIYGAVGFSTKLDFTEAQIDFPEIEIELNVTAGAVQLVVPRSATVNAEQVQVAVLNDRRR